MKIEFKNLCFRIIGEQIRLISGFGLTIIQEDDTIKNFPLVEVQIAGENHDAHCGAKQLMSSEGMKLKYVNHTINSNELVINQTSELVLVKTYITAYDNTNTLHVYNEIVNISDREIVLEQANTLSIAGFGTNGIDSCNDLFLHRFTNSWHVECQIQVNNFFDLGLYRANIRSLKRISGCNTGSWSTKEELPQAIIEDRKQQQFTMFQIESSGSWYWEIGENDEQLYLNVGGPNQHFNQWSKKLKRNEKYETVHVAICTGISLNKVISEITNYRRNIVKHCAPFRSIPAIFNEYMHASWDNPSEENTKIMAPVVANLGIEYYVIDCGWHDEEDSVYPYVGKWHESKKRFPSGIKKTIEFLHSLGMKAGLWLEIEAVGYLCDEMISHYGEDCFFHRNGQKILTMGRHQLDFRNVKARSYIEEVFKKLIEDCQVDYIKIDYNQCSGPGTETNSDSLGDGLLEHTRAYLSWIRTIMDTYSHVVFEACASGGQRMDYATLSAFPVQSTSDQTDYRKYPYIAGNITSAVLPEQAAVWSYPITEELGAKDISNERIAMNMINSFLGCMHLASRLEKLLPEQLEIVKEGIIYFNKLSTIKRQSTPYFPVGWTGFNKSFVASGLLTDKILYLAVWNLKNSYNESASSNLIANTTLNDNTSHLPLESSKQFMKVDQKSNFYTYEGVNGNTNENMKTFANPSSSQERISNGELPISKTIISAEKRNFHEVTIKFCDIEIDKAQIVYPSFSKTEIFTSKHEITINFEDINMARFMEIVIK